MTSTQYNLAQQIADALSDWSAVVDWSPRYKPFELDSRRVTIVPGSMAWQRETRAMTLNRCNVAILVQQRLSDGDVTRQIDGIVQTAEAIADHLLESPDLPGANAILREIQTDPVPDPDHLDEYRVVSVAVTATYTVVR